MLIDASKLNSILHVQAINMACNHFPTMEQNLDHLLLYQSINYLHKMSTEAFIAYYYCTTISKRHFRIRNYGFGLNILVKAEIISNNLTNFVWIIHIITIGESKQWTNYFFIPVLCLVLLHELFNSISTLPNHLQLRQVTATFVIWSQFRSI